MAGRGKKMGWLTGLEPATTGITIRGSTTELQPPSYPGAVGDYFGGVGN